jgi:hypothetical protein
LYSTTQYTGTNSPSINGYSVTCTQNNTKQHYARCKHKFFSTKNSYSITHIHNATLYSTTQYVGIHRISARNSYLITDTPNNEINNVEDATGNVGTKYSKYSASLKSSNDHRVDEINKIDETTFVVPEDADDGRPELGPFSKINVVIREAEEFRVQLV